MKIKEMIKGDNNIALMIKTVEEKETAAKKPYLQFLLTDGEADITVLKWDCDMGYANTVGAIPGSVFDYIINVGEYNGKPSYKAFKMEPSTLPQSMFVAQIDERASMLAEMTSVARNFENKQLSTLVRYFLETEQYKGKLLNWSAAKSVHHNLIGGLVYHMYRMYRQANALVYDKAYDKEILLAGVILHDIGKLQELETDALGNADYTRDGNLFGHAALGMMMVRDAGQIFNVPKDIVDQIMHIIASHHGKLEWGAITLPQTTEAYIVHELDMLDSRMYQYEKHYDTLEVGECTERIYSLDNSKIYKF